MRALAACALVLAALPALAEPPAPPPQAPPGMVDPDSEVARRHFDRGSELYEQQKYPEAIAEFKAAYEARPLPRLDFDIARCYDRLGRWKDALDYYRRYLAAVGDRPEGQDVRVRVAQLEERLRREAPPPTPAPPRPAPPPARPWRLRLTAIVLGAAAVGAVATGGGMYGWAAADYPARQSYCASLPRECVPAEWADLQARVDAAYALWAIGGALAVGDAVVWALDLKHRRGMKHAWLAPTLGGILAGGSF